MTTRHVTYLTAKAVERGGDRWIEGWATTPAEDRMGDIVLPEGAVYRLPLPLLFAHKHDEPIGSVVEAFVTKAGIRIRAKLTAGVSRAEEVWRLLQDGALTAVSVGFRVLKSSPLPNGGLRFDKWDWHELSVVSVPANTEARISVGKSMCYAVAEPKVVYYPREDVVEDFKAAVASLPAGLQKQVCELRSSRMKERWHLRDQHGAEIAQVPPIPEVQPAPPSKPAARALRKTKEMPLDAEALGKVIGVVIREMLKPVRERLDALEKQTTERGIRFKGFWSAGMTARLGDAVTNDGSLWIAVRDTDEAPTAMSPDWCLCARKGRDAR